jgi:ribosome maturation factor RimP
VNGLRAHFFIVEVTMNVAQLTQVIAPAVAAAGYELVGCEYISQGRYSVLRIYIDKESGITVEDCAVASRHISAVLDVEEVVSGNYHLEVSSPGIERPLFTLEQYQKVLGETVQVRLRSPIKGRRNFKGRLEQATKDTITLAFDEQVFELPFETVDKARVCLNSDN